MYLTRAARSHAPRPAAVALREGTKGDDGVIRADRRVTFSRLAHEHPTKLAICTVELSSFTSAINPGWSPANVTGSKRDNVGWQFLAAKANDL
jgi:hypothetical protein